MMKTKSLSATKLKTKADSRESTAALPATPCTIDDKVEDDYMVDDEDEGELMDKVHCFQFREYKQSPELK